MMSSERSKTLKVYEQVQSSPTRFEIIFKQLVTEHLFERVVEGELM